MSFDLTRARPNKPTGTLSRVCGESEANEWGRVVWEGFGGAVVTPEYLALARHLAARKENKLYLLRDGSDAVSSALLHHTERSCGLYYFATPPEFRRRGHAKRLMEFLVNEAARDYKEMVLLATPEGLPLYSAFGYRALAEIPMRSDSEEL